MNLQSPTLGEYIRRLRRGRKWSLHTLADETGLSYSHLSRIENDSTVPRADTVVRIGEALGGDLKLMLELANSLPKIILDRLESRHEAGSDPVKRSAGFDSNPPPKDVSLTALADEIARTSGLSDKEAVSIARIVKRLAQLNEHHRDAVMVLIRSLSADG